MREFYPAEAVSWGGGVPAPGGRWALEPPLSGVLLACRLYARASAGYSRASADKRYPAPGNRHRDSGTLWSVGNNGNNWLSTIYGGSAHNLGFATDWVEPKTTTYRAFGLQVRCLLE